MDTIFSSLSNLNISFFIPRRGKGHTEVLSNVSLNIEGGEKEPEDFLTPFVDYQKKVLDKEVLKDIGERFSEYSPSSFSMNISFSLPITKVSPSLDNSLHYYLDCSYSVYYIDEKINTMMTVECPIRVKYISVLQGNLSISVSNPVKYLYFEDVLDAVQKYGGTSIYPILDFKGIEELGKEIDRGKDMIEYINKLKKYIVKYKLGDGGKVVVGLNDVYNNYYIEKGVKW